MGLEKQVSPLRCAPVEMTGGWGGGVRLGLEKQVSPLRFHPSEQRPLAGDPGALRSR